MLTIRVEFNNETECVLDGVVEYKLNKNFLKVKFTNGCVRKFDRENIKELEELKKWVIMED
jgi:hypothetical protein